MRMAEHIAERYGISSRTIYRLQRAGVDLKNLPIVDTARWVRPREAAELLRVKKGTIYRWASEGILESVLVPKRTMYISLRSIEECIKVLNEPEG